jgi:hypothetical protein
MSAINTDRLIVKRNDEIEYEFEGEDFTFDKLIEKIHEIMGTYAEYEQYKPVIIRFDANPRSEDSAELKVVVTFHRPETDEEVESRIRYQMLREAQKADDLIRQEERERATLAALSEKFGYKLLPTEGE